MKSRPMGKFIDQQLILKAGMACLIMKFAKSGEPDQYSTKEMEL